MSISIPGADYTPQLTGYTGQGAFRFWCQKVLPIVYDDSLSYYELLNKVVNYLNNVIADVANVEDNVGKLKDSYISLQSYVNEHMQEIVDVVNEYTEFTTNYFNNLDVQKEINTKLDKMASDGSLSALIGPIVAITAPDIITQWLTEHITPTSPPVDNTLTIRGAAADAKVTGEKITGLSLNPQFLYSELRLSALVDNGGNVYRAQCIVGWGEYFAICGAGVENDNIGMVFISTNPRNWSNATKIPVPVKHCGGCAVNPARQEMVVVSGNIGEGNNQYAVINLTTLTVSAQGRVGNFNNVMTIAYNPEDGYMYYVGTRTGAGGYGFYRTNDNFNTYARVGDIDKSTTADKLGLPVEDIATQSSFVWNNYFYLLFDLKTYTPNPFSERGYNQGATVSRYTFDGKYVDTEVFYNTGFAREVEYVTVKNGRAYILIDGFAFGIFESTIGVRNSGIVNTYSIRTGSDLNAYIYDGYYVSNSKATTNSISNLPNGFPETNFALRVEKLGTTNGAKQTLYSGNLTNRAWVRNLYENFISPWREIQYVDEG